MSYAANEAISAEFTAIEAKCADASDFSVVKLADVIVSYGYRIVVFSDIDQHNVVVFECENEGWYDEYRRIDFADDVAGALRKIADAFTWMDTTAM